MATTYDIKINSTQAESSLKRLQSGLQTTNSAFSGMKNALAGIAATGFIANTFAMANAITDLSTALGVSTKTILGFQQAVAQNGGTSDQARDSIGKFMLAIEGAASGSLDAQAKFLKLGITIDDLRTLTDEQLFIKAVKGFKDLGTSAEATRIRVDLFGKSMRGVALDQVARQLDGNINSNAKYASSIQAAGDASQNFSDSVGKLQIAILAVLEPLSKTVNEVLANVDAVASAIKIIAILVGGYLAWVKILNPLMNLLHAFALSTLSTNVALASQSTILIGLGKYLQETLDWFKVAGGIWTTNIGILSKLGISLGSVIVGLGRMSLVAAAVVAANELIKASFDYDFIDSAALKLEQLTTKYLPGAAKAINDLGKSLGMGPSPLEKLTQIPDNPEAVATAERNATVLRDALDANEKYLTSLRETNKAYKDQIAQSDRLYTSETNLIGKSQEITLLFQERNKAWSDYIQVYKKLSDEYNTKSKSTNELEKQQAKEIAKAMAELNATYKNHQSVLKDLVSERTRETQANQLKLFQTQSLIDAETKLRDIGLQSSTMLLPEINRQYQEIATNAKASADAAIKAEEARRQAPLSLDEVRDYYKAAFDGVIGLIDAQTELNAVTDQYNLKQFGIKERINLENELIKIQGDMAKTTMTDIEKKYYDIDAAAKASAKSAIDAEEARRGAPLNIEEQKRYYEEAAKGSDILKEKQRELYENSRSFNTGWKNALNEYVDDATNAAKQAERLFTKMAQSMEDSIVSFAKTGKFEFKGFLNSILEDLLRSQVRQLIGQLFGGSGGGSGGSAILGAIGSVGKAFGGLFANGGTLGAGKWGIAGERGAELISGPATITPLGAGGGSTYVNYTIQAVDAMSFKQLVARDPSFIHAVAEQGRKSVPQTRR